MPGEKMMIVISVFWVAVFFFLGKKIFRKRSRRSGMAATGAAMYMASNHNDIETEDADGDFDDGGYDETD